MPIVLVVSLAGGVSAGASLSLPAAPVDKGIPGLRDVTAVVGDGQGGWIFGGNDAHGAALFRISGSGSVAWRLPVQEAGIAGFIRALARNGSVVYAGGLFHRFGGKPRSNAAAVTVATGQVLPWDPQVGGPMYQDPGGGYSRLVDAIAVAGGRVYIAGFFTTVQGKSRANLAVVDPTAGRLVAPELVTFQARAPTEIFAIAVSGHTIYFGGYFEQVNGRSRHAAAAVDVRNGKLLAWNPRVDTTNGYYPTPFSGQVNAIQVRPHDVVLAGEFWKVHGQKRWSIAAVSPATGIPTPWAPRLTNPSPPDSFSPGSAVQVHTIALTQSRLLIGGNFAKVNGLPQRYAALVDPGGRLLPWAPKPDDEVDAIAVQEQQIGLAGRFGLTRTATHPSP